MAFRVKIFYASLLGLMIASPHQTHDTPAPEGGFHDIQRIRLPRSPFWCAPYFKFLSDAASAVRHHAYPHGDCTG